MKKEFLAKLADLPDEEFQHIMAVCADVAKRLPEHAFGSLFDYKDCQAIEYTPPAPKTSVKMAQIVIDGKVVQEIPVEVNANDVVVGLRGVSGKSEQGGVV